MLERSCLKSNRLGFSIIWTKNFQMSKLGLEKAEEPNIKFLAFAGSKRKQGNSIKASTCFIDYAKTFDCVHNKLWKLLKRWEYQSILPVFWESCTRVKKQQLEPCMENWLIQDWERSTWGCLLSPVYLTDMLSTSWEKPDCMSYKLESR